MKYKITKIRERGRVIGDETVQFVKAWYEVPLMQYRGIIEIPKSQFSEELLVEKIQAEVKELSKVQSVGEIEDSEK